MKRAFSTLAVSAMLAAGVVGAQQVSRLDAARLQSKLDRINAFRASGKTTGLRTPVTETELNAYVRYEMRDRIPAGVQDPWISLLQNGHLVGKANVDLGRVAQSRKSASALDPFAYMSGVLPVEVNGILTTKNGTGSFALESASISGVPVPAWMLQEIVSYYSKSEASPQGIAIDKPFMLPSGIREIQLAQGQAVVVQ
jgi:hypothetical protein